MALANTQPCGHDGSDCPGARRKAGRLPRSPPPRHAVAGRSDPAPPPPAGPRADTQQPCAAARPAGGAGPPPQRELSLHRGQWVAWCCMAAGPAAGVGVHGRRHPDLAGDTGLGPWEADSADAWAAPVRPIRPRGEQEAEAGRLQWTCAVPSLTHPQAALPAPRTPDHCHVPRTRHLPTPALPRASPLLTWAQQQVNVAPPLPAPPGFTRGHSFPPETYEGAAGPAGHQGG